MSWPHVRRGDYLANLLQTIAETLLFYHPGVWYASGRLRVEREYCADQLALEVCGDGAQYARALISVEENAASMSSLAMGFGSGSLVGRIRRILGLSTHDAGRTGSWLGGAALSVAILLLLITAPAIHASVQLAAAPRVEIERVWADDATFASGSISPDGRYLSYVNWDRGNLGVRDLADGVSRLLTSDGSWDEPNRYAEAPFWSPDSTEIAFTWLINEQPELRIVPLAGGETRTVYRPEPGGWVYGRDWSPDGKHILANTSTPAGEKAAVLIPVAGDGAPRVLVNFPAQVNERVFSPDGNYIAFARGANGSPRNIHIYDLKANEVTSVIQHPADDYAPLFSGDGNWLTFVSTRDGTQAAWMAPFQNGEIRGEPVQLSPLIANSRILGIADEGTYYFGKSRSSSNVFVAAYDPVAGTASAAELLVKTFQGRNLKPKWSNDGNQLLFLSLRAAPAGGTQRVFVVRDERDSSGAGEQVIKIDDAQRMNLPVSGLAWARGSNSFYVSTLVRTNNPQVANVWLLNCDVDSGQTKQIDSFRSASPTLAISPSGEATYHLRWDDSKTMVFRRNLADGVRTSIAEVDETLIQAAIAPDGKKLVLQGAQALWTVDVSSQRADLLFRLSDQSQLITRGAAWTADSNKVVFAIDEVGPPAQASLMQIDATGGQPQPLGIVMPEISEVQVHPNGRQIAFTGRSDAYRAEVWSVKNSLLSRQVP